MLAIAIITTFAPLTQSADVRFETKLRQWATILAGAIALTALLVLAGWVFDLKYFIHPPPKLPPMNPMTAVTFLLFSSSFFLLASAKGTSVNRIVAQGIALLIVFIGIGRLVSGSQGVAFKADTLLFPDKILAEATDPLYSRMSPIAAICFILAGAALLLLRYETRRNKMPAHYLSLAIGFVGLFCFLEYICNVKVFYGSLVHVPMAIHTALCFLLMSMAILVSVPDKGLMRPLTNNLAGSHIAIQLIPIAIVLPMALELLRLYIQLAGIITGELQLTIAIMTIIVSLVGLIIYNARLLNKRDLESKEAGEEVQRLNAGLEQKVAERTAEIQRTEKKFRVLIENSLETISLCDENLTLIYRSPSAHQVTGWSMDERLQKDSFAQHVHPDDLVKFKATIAEVLQCPGVPFSITIRARHKQGHYIWVDGVLRNMLHDESVNAIVSTFRDVTQIKEHEQQIVKLTEELRLLLDQMWKAREEDRKHIAREIHDELGQLLSAVKIDVCMLKKRIKANSPLVENTLSGHSPLLTLSNHKIVESSDPLREEFNSIIRQIDKSIETVKRIATELRPEILDHLGIVEAVESLMQQFEKKTGIRCSVAHLPREMDFDPVVSNTIYRSVQEALTNIARHANATTVHALLELYQNELLLEVHDNGKGITAEQLTNSNSLGLIGMRERVHALNGSLSITGAPLKGTTVTITIPINEYKSN